MEPLIDHIEITVKDMAIVRFRAESRADVDRLCVELQAIGATIVQPPREYTEYTPAGYYALYFKDLEGIKYEIVCTRADSGQP